MEREDKTRAKMTNLSKDERRHRIKNQKEEETLDSTR
jgi:hypothetical protein